MKPRLGAVVVFKPGVSKTDVEIALAKLEVDGLLDPELSSFVHVFDPDTEGYPVWYIP